MPTYKVVFDYDTDPDLSWLEQWDTPEKYQGNEVLDRKTRKPMPFDEYMETYGNPERHVTLEMLKYKQCDNDEHCTQCNGWELIDSLGGIDFMDWDNPFVGTLIYNSFDEIKERLADYQKDLLR